MFIFRTNKKWQLWSLWRLTFRVPGMLHYATLFIINVSLFCLATRCADDNSFTQGKLRDNGKKGNHFILHSMGCNHQVGMCRKKKANSDLRLFKVSLFSWKLLVFVCLERKGERKKWICNYNIIGFRKFTWLIICTLDRVQLAWRKNFVYFEKLH